MDRDRAVYALSSRAAAALTTTQKVVGTQGRAQLPSPFTWPPPIAFPCTAAPFPCTVPHPSPASSGSSHSSQSTSSSSQSPPPKKR
ncbi:hypothetical protein HaLaN_10031 [Haematococcus lacustris]|uniref:Uncharacterized protein n=1 Tax=Haematococcus lacustris TaxID=44745 RepID=A0A699YXX2_HAELA|nr:hypothetical protein HaLaN_10031 [Haematococcus lacustris]